MAYALVNIPKDLLTQIDLEADRRGITRDAVLHSAARGEIDRSAARRLELIKRMEAAAANWSGGPQPTTEMVRQDRHRDDPR